WRVRLRVEAWSAPAKPVQEPRVADEGIFRFISLRTATATRHEQQPGPRFHLYDPKERSQLRDAVQKAHAAGASPGELAQLGTAYRTASKDYVDDVIAEPEGAELFAWIERNKDVPLSRVAPLELKDAD